MLYDFNVHSTIMDGHGLHPYSYNISATQVT